MESVCRETYRGFESHPHRMIPLVSYFNLTTAILAGVGAIKLFLSYQKTTNVIIGYFAKFYFFVAGIFVFYALPGLASDNLAVIGIFYIIALPFIFLAAAYLISVPLTFWRLYFLRKIVFWSIVVLIPTTVLINLLNFSPAQQVVIGGLVDWDSVEAPAVRFLISISGFIGLLAGIFFFIEAIKAKTKWVKIRSFIIGFGVLLLGLASVLNFAVALFSEKSLELILILASVSAFLSLVLILLGIYLKKDSEAQY